MTTGYFEDVVVGTVLEFGSKTVSKEEIIHFATKYDPQPFHIDEEAAQASPYGGIIASGWHTAGMAMRMMVDNMINDRVGLGSPGWDNLKWHLPVRPDDTLRVRTEVIRKKRSASKPMIGTIFGSMKVLNQHDQIVMSVETIGMVKARTIGEAEQNR
ncbi:MaoC family dehydratase [Sneathiella sp.]|jgi:acyl dehydratase|uniref:MaoC family dehydratase n=1 Tax=Sneathiella sp. TaxID=1964365 RepID=UPI0039E47BDF